MADDLNSDKFLEACRNAATNHLYRWLSDPEEGKRAARRPPQTLCATREAFADLAAAAQAPHGLTERAARDHRRSLADRVLVVQGPPGTGKSHTLGFAILARALALATPARPFRVAVLAKTHAAVSVALESIAKRRRELTRGDQGRRARAHPALPLVAPLARLRLAKVCNDAGEAVPEGVERVLPDGGDDATAAEQWESLLSEQLLVVGGTPGGLYRLVKQGASRGRAVDWSAEHFDLVVVDEASQMGIAEALTAAAFLREDGQFIAVGDHRQMPPILAHAWDRESRRDLKRARPHLSVFEYLSRARFRARGARRVVPHPARDRRLPAPARLRRRRHRLPLVERQASARRRDFEEAWLRGGARARARARRRRARRGGLAAVERVRGRARRGASSRAAVGTLGLDAARGIGVVVPAPRAEGAARVAAAAPGRVDRHGRALPGRRARLIVVSATVSDREFAASESSFLLEPRRLTVAVSRPTHKLVVVASRAVFDLIPADLDEYERGALWKHLRHESGARGALWEGEIDGHHVSVRAI